MLPVVWHPDAEQDLLEIVSFVAEHNLNAAEQLGRLIYDSTYILSEYPYLYKASERKPGWREMVVHPNYLVFYRVHKEYVQIDKVAHARQQYPKR